MIKRIKELVYKTISIKGLFTGTTSVLFFLNPEKDWAFWAFITAWLVFIGERLALKILTILKK